MGARLVQISRFGTIRALQASALISTACQRDGVVMEPQPGVWHLHSIVGGAFDVSAVKVSSEGKVIVDGVEASVLGPGEWVVGKGSLVTHFELRAISDHSLGGSVKRCEGSSCAEQGVEGRRVGHAPWEAAPLPELARLHLGSESTQALAVRGTRDSAFVACAQDGLYVVDIRDASRGVLRELAHIQADPNDVWNDLRVYGNTIVIASQRHGILVVDVTSPGAPRLLVPGIPQLEGHDVHTVWLDGTRAFLTDRTAARVVEVDLAEPEAPRVGTSFGLDGAESVHSITVLNDRAYVAHWDAGLAAFDIGDRTAPRLLNHVDTPLGSSHTIVTAPSAGGPVLIHGEEGWGAHAEIRSIEDLSVRSTLPNRPEVSPHDVACVDSRCFLASYQDGVFAFDPARPETFTAHLPTWNGPGKTFLEGASGVDVDGDLLLVADTRAGLIVAKAAP